jgi:hypothetical protein
MAKLLNTRFGVRFRFVGDDWLLIDVDENWLTKQDDGTAITATNNCSIPV